MKRRAFLYSVSTAAAGAFLAPAIAHTSEREVYPERKLPKLVKHGEGENFIVLGDHMTFKLTGKDTGGQYALFEQNNRPGTGIPMHLHENEDEVFKIIAGQIEFMLDKESFVLGPGDMIFCPRHIPHSWKVVGEQNARVDVGFFPAGLENMFEAISKLPPGPPDMETIGKLLNQYGITMI